MVNPVIIKCPLTNGQSRARSRDSVLLSVVVVPRAEAGMAPLHVKEAAPSHALGHMPNPRLES